MIHDEQKVMESRYRVPLGWVQPTWGRHARMKRGLFEVATELSGPIKGLRVLDAGCGDGWFATRLDALGGKVTAVDYSERAVAFAKLIVPEVEFHAASITALPFLPKSFDRIFSFQVLEHVPPEEFSKAVDELSRVLVDDGLLIVSVPSLNRKLSKAHFRHFTLEVLEEALSSRFTLVRASGQEHHDLSLHVIERVLENRWYALIPFLEKFNQGAYLSHWNKVSVEKGQNIVAVFQKKGQ